MVDEIQSESDDAIITINPSSSDVDNSEEQLTSNMNLKCKEVILDLSCKGLAKYLHDLHRKDRGFWGLLVDELKDPTKILLLVSIAALACFRVKEDGIIEGWFEICGIIVTLIVIVLSAGSNFVQVRGFDNSKMVPIPIQAGILKLASYVGMVACIIALLELLEKVIHQFNGSSKEKTMSDIIDLASLSRCVMTMFEGFSFAVNIAVSFYMKRMKEEGIMVKNPSVCEEIGATTVICIETTDVLRMDKMTVERVQTGLDGNSTVDEDNAPRSVSDPKFRELYSKVVGLSTTTGSVCKSRVPGSRIHEYSGSLTERTLLSWGVTELGMDMNELHARYTILNAETFKPEQKTSGSVVLKKADKTTHVYWKGAPEKILEMCSMYYDHQMRRRLIGSTERNQLVGIIEAMATRRLKGIAFAHKEVDLVDDMEHQVVTDNYKQGLVWVGAVGMGSPSIQGINDDVNTLKSAGIQLKLISGDHISTVTGMALDCGLLEHDNGKVLNAEEFSGYTDEEKINSIDGIQVIARASPSQKLDVVHWLQKNKHVVVVLANDPSVPALKKADVGVCSRRYWIKEMTIRGENVDIVTPSSKSILFSVTEALISGRAVNNNIKNFIQLQLPPNVAAICINYICAASGRVYSITAAEIVWVNLITLLLGVVGLAIQRPIKEFIMKKPPVLRSAPIITNIMWRNILTQSSFQILGLTIFLFKGTLIFKVDESVNHTIVFNTFVLCQVANAFNSRDMEDRNVFKGLHKNLPFFGIVVVVIAVQAVMVEVFFMVFPDTGKLSLIQWVICIAFASISCLIDCLFKSIPVPNRPYLISYIVEKMSPTSAAKPDSKLYRE